MLVTPGAAAALFIVATALLDAGAHALVVRPNYATNLETPRALGAEVEHLDLRFEDGWRLDVERPRPRAPTEHPAREHLRAAQPDGPTLDLAALRAIVDLVERHGSARLLVDETYRELAYGKPLPLAAGLSQRVIGVSSMSKTYGLPGLRIGWLTCCDRDLMVTFLAAKEQIVITGAAIDETMAARVLEQRGRILPPSARGRDRALDGQDVDDGQDVFEWVEPPGGVVCFPRIRAEHAVDTRASTRRCSTPRHVRRARATGSSRTRARSASASAGRSRRSWSAAWRASSPPPARAPECYQPALLKKLVTAEPGGTSASQAARTSSSRSSSPAGSSVCS